MKRTVLILFVCLLTLTVSSQDVESIRLQQTIRQHPQEDTFRVNRLNELVNSRAVPVEEMEKLATEALSISRKIGYASGEGYALINLGYAKFLVRNYKEAMRFILEADSIAKKTHNDELSARVLLNLGNINQSNDNKKALEYYLKGEKLAAKTPNKQLLSIIQYRIASLYEVSLSDLPKTMEYALKSMSSAEDGQCLRCLALSWAALAEVYGILGDQENALLYYQKAVDANKKLGNKAQERVLLTGIGERFRLTGKYSEAVKMYKKSLEGEEDPLSIEINESNLADVYLRMDSMPVAFYYGFKTLKAAKEISDLEGMAWIQSILSRAYLKKDLPDSAIHYALEGFDVAKESGTIEYMRDNAEALAKAYAIKKDFANAYKYHVLYINYRDSMANAQVTNKVQVLRYNSDLQKKQAEIAALNQQKKIQRNFLITALIVLVLIIITAAALFRNNRNKQKANKLLQKQKHEIEEQRDQTNKLLEELQQTQKQLIQSEKMASLGELTAGIAHEIQNPLNFVNNFSEVSIELVDELKHEAKEGNKEEVIAIAGDIAGNLQKVVTHGKRADSIVKSMMEHSRTSRGERQPTDINALADEYLRLAYHGMRGKDKSFNATLETHFDESMGKIKVVPQDIGRVLLNLYNNAFYAVAEKKKQFVDKYEPVVSVTTKKENDKVIITVRDNGSGIPKKVKDKIFQPFFTTKPTGQGTGLGLSLSYDIVKAHGGEIRAETKEGEGSEFIIELAITPI